MRLSAIVLSALLVPAFATAAPAAPAAKSGKTNWTERVKKGDDLYATLETNQGDITVKLYSKQAPNTVSNFVGLASGEKEWTDPRTGKKVSGKPFYDGLIFHRVIPNFMIQGGDPMGTGMGGPGYQFADENQGSFEKACILAMANAGPNTNGSQFFITEKPTPWLNGHYNVFGEGVRGCELVTKIAGLPKNGERPVQDVVIKHVVISDKAPGEKAAPKAEQKKK